MTDAKGLSEELVKSWLDDMAVRLTNGTGLRFEDFCNFARLSSAYAALAERLKELQDIIDGDKHMDALLWKKLNEAAEAIKAGDQWPDNHWPSPVERCWYVAAQERLKACEEERDGLQGQVNGIEIDLRQTVEKVSTDEEVAQYLHWLTEEQHLGMPLSVYKQINRLLNFVYAVKEQRDQLTADLAKLNTMHQQITAVLHDDEMPAIEPIANVVEDAMQMRRDLASARERLTRLQEDVIEIHERANRAEADLQRARAEVDRLKNEVIIARNLAELSSSLLEPRDRQVEHLKAALARERGCDECWKGQSCGTDCHMNDVCQAATATERGGYATGQQQ